MLPEAERELDLHNDVEHHFAVKKEADVVLSQTELDWVILRPSRLVDGPGVGTVTLDPVVLHGQMTSADAAETLRSCCTSHASAGKVLVLDQGLRAIREAVLHNVRPVDGMTPRHWPRPRSRVTMDCPGVRRGPEQEACWG